VLAELSRLRGYGRFYLPLRGAVERFALWRWPGLASAARMAGRRLELCSAKTIPARAFARSTAVLRGLPLLTGFHAIPSSQQ